MHNLAIFIAAKAQVFIVNIGDGHTKLRHSANGGANKFRGG